MQPPDWLADNLRARLAIEQTQEAQKSKLAAAKSDSAVQNRRLTSEIIETRHEVEVAQSEAAHLRDVNAEVQLDLAEARSAIRIAERRLWDSLETIRDGFAVFDSGQRLIAANRAFLRSFSGLESATIGTRAEDLLRLAAEEGIVDCGPVGRDVWIEKLLQHMTVADASPVTIDFWNGAHARLVHQHTRDGDIVVVAMDITATIRREQELKDARERAEAASRAKSAFLAKMSHEIRTPMNGVLAMAELLAEGDLTGDQRAYVDTIRSSGEALMVIINDVLDFSQIEADRLTLHLAPMDLEQSIHDVVQLLQPIALEKAIELIVDYDMFLPTRFLGDEGRLRQVLTNLIGNALKFTPEGHVLIRAVGVPSDAGDDQRIEIVVQDTGIGIAEEMQQHIFGEFNQAENGHTRTFDGTGLGLAITGQLVDLMGGEIWVDSVLGEGATFGVALSLPLSGEPDALPSRAPDWIGRAIIVDPNPVGRDVLQRQLGAIGLTTRGCATPGEIGVTDDGADTVIFIADRASAAAEEVRRAEVAAVFVLTIGSNGPEAVALPGDGIIQRPFLRRSLVDALDALPCPEPVATPALEQRSMRVLAAEDNKTNQFILSRLLKDSEILLTMVENGEEALRAFREDPPDVVLTDVSMPVMDGRVATREIRSYEAAHGLSPRVIVAMTAHAGPDTEAELRACGVDHYLTKPLNKGALLEVIGAARAVPPDV